MTRRPIIPYNPKLKNLARDLRKNSTLSEVLLWNQLKSRQIRGYRFLRQKPIDDFIVDFFCPDLMLAIEIDGQSHDQRLPEDIARQKRIESLGIVFLRFLDIDVKINMEGVIERIRTFIEEFDGESEAR